MLASSWVVTSLLLIVSVTATPDSGSSDLHGFDGTKRRYLSSSGLRSMRRYLQRKYHLNYRRNEVPVHKKKYFSNTWAVQVEPPKKAVADRVAKKHGFVNIGKV